MMPSDSWISREEIHRDTKSRLHEKYDRPTDQAIESVKNWSSSWENGA